MKIKPLRHLLIGGMEMSISKSDPIISYYFQTLLFPRCYKADGEKAAGGVIVK